MHTFKPGPFGGPWIFASNETATICGDVAEYSVAKPAQTGHVLVQAEDRKYWGSQIPPGYYRTITTLYEWPVCIFSELNGHLGVDGPSTGGYIIQAYGDKAASSGAQYT